MNLRYMFLILFAINGLSYSSDLENQGIRKFSSGKCYDIQCIYKMYDSLVKNTSHQEDSELFRLVYSLAFVNGKLRDFNQFSLQIAANSVLVK